MSLSTSDLAVLSDIHGNRWALASVLDDVKRRGLQQLVDLGDSLYGPLDPAGTADMLAALDLPTVRGNQDRVLIEQSTPSASSPTLSFVRDQLTPGHLSRLESLPITAVAAGECFMCHGSPDNDDQYLLWDVTSTGPVRRSRAELSIMLANVAYSVILCGHDHTPATIRLDDGRLIVNPGSVGLPAYVDDLPYPHAMETGSPEARYAIVYRSRGEWRAEPVSVPYDHDSAIAAARSNGRPDWAAWLHTGRASV